jgi:hypothetical protein
MYGQVDKRLGNVGTDWNGDLGPLVGIKRGSKTRQGVPFSSGLGGVMSEDKAGPSRTAGPQEFPMLTITSSSPRNGRKDAKKKSRAMDFSMLGPS